MLLRLQRNVPQSALDSIFLLCKELGYRARHPGGRADLLELFGPGSPGDRSRFEDLSGVAQVLDPGEARELHELAARGAPSQVRVGDAAFGAGAVSLVAGPCAIEDEERLVEIARGVRAAGATLLRGGAFKPRTSPYSFRGSGQRGLESLARVKAETGLAVVTEVLDPRDVEAVGAVADMFQIGARSMSNFALLSEVGRTRTPVLLKRGFGARVRELLLAAEYVLAEGNDALVLCERGVRGFDSVTRNLLDVGAVAYLKRVSHLPVIVDPSHAAGRADLVRPLARAGIAAGADGLMIEVHPAPAEVHSDGQQAVSLEAFAEIARDVRRLVEIDGRRLVQPELQPDVSA